MQATISVIATFFVLLLVAGGMYGCPQYSVYEQRLTGEAELARAEYNRQTKVREAQATLDSASLLAQSDVARAKGVAQANKIIGESLKDNEAYLRWLWIDKLDTSKQSTIYVPESGLIPFLEGGRGSK